MLGKNFHRDRSVESRVSGAIDLTHASRAQQRANVIVAEGSSDHRSGLMISEQSTGRRGLNEACGLLVRYEQRLDLAALQFLVTCTGLSEKSGALAGFALQAGFQELINLFPSFRRHHSSVVTVYSTRGRARPWLSATHA